MKSKIRLVGRRLFNFFVVRHGEPIFGDLSDRTVEYFGQYEFLSTWFYTAGEDIKYVADFFSYWSQVNISLAIAVERYIIIAMATSSDQLLSKSRRRSLYVFTSLWIIIPAVLYFLLQSSLLGAKQRSVSFKRLFSVLLTRLDEP